MNYKLHTTDAKLIFTTLAGNVLTAERGAEFDLLAECGTMAAYLKASRVGRVGFTNLPAGRKGRAMVWEMYERALEIASDNAEVGV